MTHQATRETGWAPFEVVERKDLVPLCPYCETDLPEVYSRAKGFPIVEGRTMLYFCPHCRKVLGFAQGRMI